MNKISKYPTITMRVSQEDKAIIRELKEKYYISISKMFRDKIREFYNEIKK